MTKRITLLLILCSLAIHAQTTNKTFLSDAIVNNGQKYLEECDKAILEKDMDRVKFLFDSITSKVFKGAYFDNFQVEQIGGRSLRINDFDKPTVIITLSSWYITTEGEIAAINQLAKKYKKSIDFVVLYWGNKKQTRKASKDFSSDVTITYFDELDNRGAYIVGKLKHFFGFPTCYYLNEDKSIISITRGAISQPFYTDQETVREDNYNYHSAYVKEMLIENKASSVATN
ncbi:hypothetical protein SAMN05216480_103177 [Pustulibacterium marinum]|uniref:AhpC/TSA family protein n=1 Tax=Pustulibacterium marinum TaxID=1224947 RepID=A0A1I7G4S3_9FLAO|nr:hypothetical protein [Pustulibacterium marinum]SFU43462.1 hypothetical protein SAMN05216480_103177 [Pustulibacterium marinum]